MVLGKYGDSVTVTRGMSAEAEKSWKEMLQKRALQALEINPNVNLDPDFLMTTSLTQIRGEYEKQIGKSSSPSSTSSPLSESIQPLPKQAKIGPRLTGKANYEIISKKI